MRGFPALELKRQEQKEMVNEFDFIYFERRTPPPSVCSQHRRIGLQWRIFRVSLRNRSQACSPSGLNLSQRFRIPLSKTFCSYANDKAESCKIQSARGIVPPSFRKILSIYTTPFPPRKKSVGVFFELPFQNFFQPTQIKEGTS